MICNSQGTNLWKINKKDDCYDVYLDSCVEISEQLITAALKYPLTDAIALAKSQSGESKHRGAVTLRKALDKFLADVAQVCF